MLCDKGRFKAGAGGLEVMSGGGGLSRQGCAAGSQGHEDQSPSFFSSHIQEEIRPPQCSWVSLLSTLDFRAASQTPLSNLCRDGNKTFFSEPRSDCGVDHEVL